MREILFRGKRKDNGAWETGSLIIRRMYTRENIVQIGDKMTAYPTEVIPETVGEYTGLNDDNGKKIFEGDIIRIVDKSNEFEFIAIVEFGNPNGLSSWGWQLNIISGGQDVNPDILCWIETEMPETTATEIIGNIHDNKRKEA